MKTSLKWLNALILGFAASAWTGAGETSDPVLADREIPADVISACVSPRTGQVGTCVAAHLSRRWVAMTPAGDLFILTNEGCLGRECRAWLVEKSGAGVTALLGFDASFRLRGDRNGYPVIESYTALSASEGAYSRYEWNGSAYARTASRLVYSVDGEECGTRTECRLAASKAIDQKRLDRAVRIWENVGGVSWI